MLATLRTASAVAELRRGEGGERGIRTLGTREGTAVFETVAFDRSAISPLNRGAKVEFQTVLQVKDPVFFAYFCNSWRLKKALG
jgi:hypothetical protein